MMNNKNLVLGLLKTILGDYKPSSKDNYAFHCPFCNHHKPKLEINPSEGLYNCWTCNPATKGHNLVSLLKKLKAKPEKIKEMQMYFPSTAPKKIKKSFTFETVSLPEEFISLSKDCEKDELYKKVTDYLKGRDISYSDILKYNIGYCKEGKYKNSIIIPSYDYNGDLNYFVSRSLDENAEYKYNAPQCNKNEIIGFEYFINWNVPVMLCEGSFDAIAIKRNAVPLFGKTISKKLKIKLINPQVKAVYLALDNDALKEALAYSKELIDLGKEVYLIELEGKDPSKIGFEAMTKQLHNAKKLTFKDLLLKTSKI